MGKGKELNNNNKGGWDGTKHINNETYKWKSDNELNLNE